jgi:hypothetical protein
MKLIGKDKSFNHPVFLLIFAQICTKQESTPPESGGETFIAHFQTVSPPNLGGVPKSMRFNLMV